METILKKIYITIVFIGLLFFGGGFLIALGQHFIYNGFGKVFEYVRPDSIVTVTKIDSVKQLKTISYKYWVNDEMYLGEETVYIPNIEKVRFYETNILYNKSIPSFSYIGTEPVSPITGMVIMGFFFLFIFLIYKFADTDKWIGVYTRGEYKSSRK